LPGEFGSWDAVYNWLGRWVRSGSLEQLFILLTDSPNLGGVRRGLIEFSHEPETSVNRIWVKQEQLDQPIEMYA